MIMLYFRRLLLLLALVYAGSASAYQITKLSVDENDGAYTVRLEVHISAPPSRVYAVLADVYRLPQLNPAITKVSAVPSGLGLRVEMLADGCMLGICRSLKHVQFVRLQSTTTGGEMHAETQAVANSSFSSGTATWVVTAEEGGTLWVMNATSVPDVWVPPLVGPKMLKRNLREQTVTTVVNLERLARE